MGRSTLLQRFAIACLVLAFGAFEALAQNQPPNTNLTQLSQSARDKSTLSLGAGTFTGQLLVENKTLTVVGAGVGRTTLSSDRVATTVIVGKGGKLVLRGVRFAPRANDGVAVLVEAGGEATIEQCAVTGANAPFRVSGGALTIDDCRLEKLSGVGIRAQNDGKLVLRNTTLADLADNAVTLQGATATLERVVVERGQRNALVAAGKSTVTVHDSRFTDLTTGALISEGLAPLTVTNSVFEGAEAGVVRIGGSEPLSVSGSRFEGRGKLRVAVETAGSGNVTLDGNSVRQADAGFVMRGEGRRQTVIAGNTIVGPGRVGILLDAGKPATPEELEIRGNRLMLDGLASLQVRGGVRLQLVDNLFGGKNDVGVLIFDAVAVTSERNIVFGEREALHATTTAPGAVSSNGDLLVAPLPVNPGTQLGDDSARLRDLATRAPTASQLAERVAALRQSTDLAALERGVSGLRAATSALRREAGIGSGDPRMIAIAAPPRSALPLGMGDLTLFHRQALKTGGAFALSFRDISIPAPGMALELTRSYRSDLAHDQGFGPGWGWSLGLRLRRPAAPATHLELVEADGTVTRLLPAGPGLYRPRSSDVEGEVRSDGNGHARHFSDGRRERFDSAGRLIERRSALGVLQSITYKGDGLESIDAAGRRLAFTTDKGRIVTVTDGLQRRHTYRYDQSGRLVGVTDPLNRATTFSYATTGKLATVALPDQRTLAVEYDANGRTTQLTGPGDLRTRATHTTAAGPPRTSQTTLTDGEGRSQTVAAAETTDGLSITLTPGGGDPVSVTTSKTATRITAPDGRQSSLTFDERGAAREMRDFAGQTHNMPDLAKRLAAQAPPEPRRVVDESGLPLSIEVDGGRVGVTFDAAGRLVETGAGERFAYDAGDRLVRYQNAAGLVTTREYDAGDRLVRVVEPGDLTSEVKYDARGLPVEFKSPDAPAIAVAYDRSGLPVSVKSGNETIFYEYNAARRLVAETDGTGNRSTIDYDKLGQPTSVTTPGAGRIAFGYDANGNLARITRGDSAVGIARAADGTTTVQLPDGTTEITRPQAQGGAVVERRAGQTLLSRETRGVGGRVERLEVPGEATVEIAYDTRGRPSERKTGDKTVRYEWDDQDRLRRISDSTGAERTIAYDAAGRVIEAGPPGGGRWKLTYDAAGRVASIDDGGGWREDYVYDKAGRVQEDKTPAGVRRYAYDDAGRLVRLEMPDGPVTAYAYSDQGALLTRTITDGGATWRWQYAYDKQGRQISVTHPDGSTEALEYDSEGRVAVSRVDDSSSRFTYDRAGRVASVEGDGATTRYGYDAQGRVVEIDGKPIARYAADGLSAEYVDASGKVLRQRFDAAGNLVETVDERGGRFAYERENNGRLERRKDPDGRILVQELDAAGRLAAFGSPSMLERIVWRADDEIAAQQRADGRRIEWRRDAVGELTALTAENKPLVSWRRDARSRPTEIETPLGVQRITYGSRDEIVATEDAGGRKLAYRYDSLLRLVGVTSPEGEETSYAYDGRGALAEQRGPDGQTTRYTRDRQARPTGIAWPNGASAELAYGADGALATMRYRTADGRVVERKLTRDANGRVTAVQIGDRTWRYGYDELGRLIEQAAPDGKTSRFDYDGGGNVTSIDGVRLVYDESYRLTRRGGDEARHDANGNLLALGALTLDYDIQGRVTAAKRGDIEVAYRYDHAGRLAERRRGDDVRRYLYQLNDRRPVAVYDGAGKRLAWIERGEGLDAVRVHAASGVGFVAADELGSPFDLAAPAQVEAFGRSVSWPLAGALGYTGAITDRDVGLVFLDARAYLPEIARFVSRDPSGPEGEANPYAYAANDPVQHRDPEGTKYEVPFGPPGIDANPQFPRPPDGRMFGIAGDAARRAEGRDVLRDLFRMANNPSAHPAQRRVARETFDAIAGNHARFQIWQNAPAHHGVSRGTYGMVELNRANTANVYAGHIRNGTQHMPANRTIRRMTGVAVHEISHVHQLHRPGIRPSTAMMEFEAAFRQWIADPSLAGAGKLFQRNMNLREGLSEAIRYGRQWGGHLNRDIVRRVVQGYFPELSKEQARRIASAAWSLSERKPGHVTQRLPAVNSPGAAGRGTMAAERAAVRVAGQLDDVARAGINAARAGITAGEALRVGLHVLDKVAWTAGLTYSTYQYLEGRISTASYVGGVAFDVATLAGFIPSPIAYAYAAHHIGAFLGELAAAAVIAELQDPNSGLASFLDAVFDLPPIRTGGPPAGHACRAICDCDNIQAGILNREWRATCRRCEADLVDKCMAAAQTMTPEAALRSVGGCGCTPSGPGAKK